LDDEEFTTVAELLTGRRRRRPGGRPARLWL